MTQSTNRPIRQEPNATPECTATEVYAARRADIARLLDVIEMELERMDVGEKAWGSAGSLGKVRMDLIYLAGFLSNKDPEEVEAFLNEAE